MNRRCFEVARVAQEVSQALNFSFQVDKDNGGESLVEFLEEVHGDNINTSEFGGLGLI